MRNNGFLTWWGSVEFLFERVKQLEWEGLAFLPNINQLSDLLLQYERKVSGLLV